MSTFSIISYIALGLTTLGLTWIFSSIGKNVKTEKNRGIEESRETPEEKEAGEAKEFFIPRFIRATEQKIKERKAAKIEKEQSEKIIDEFTLDRSDRDS